MRFHLVPFKHPNIQSAVIGNELSPPPYVHSFRLFEGRLTCEACSAWSSNLFTDIRKALPKFPSVQQTVHGLIGSGKLLPSLQLAHPSSRSRRLT